MNIRQQYTWAALREKVPYGLKKIQKFKKKIFQKILKSRCHTKRRAGAAPRARPSFGMTTT